MAYGRLVRREGGEGNAPCEKTEQTGQREETDNLVKVLEPFGLIEFVRSARVAIIKASNGFHERLKEFEQTEPGEELIENEFLDKQEEVFTM